MDFKWVSTSVFSSPFFGGHHLYWVQMTWEYINDLVRKSAPKHQPCLRVFHIENSPHVLFFTKRGAVVRAPLHEARQLLHLPHRHCRGLCRAKSDLESGILVADSFVLCLGGCRLVYCWYLRPCVLQIWWFPSFLSYRFERCVSSICMWLRLLLPCIYIYTIFLFEPGTCQRLCCLKRWRVLDSCVH